MIGKSLFCLSAAAATFFGLSAGAVTTSQNVDIIVTHGAPLTTFTFVNNTGNTLPGGSPVSFGQAFRYGDVMPGNHPVIRDATTHVALSGQQFDEISTWRENGGNNSWRHAVWAIDLPNSLASGASYQVEFVTAAGAYSKSSVLALSALCSGSNSHDLKIHLSDVRNQDDTLRKTGDATFRLCDHIATTGGRDDPRILDAGPVRTMAKIVGKFKYTDASEDPTLYAECNVGLYVNPATGNSLKDTSWVCFVHNSWMTVAAGTAGHAGAPGPVGLPGDPQAISYRPEMLDGSTSVLNWNGLDATVASTSKPIQTTGCGSDNNNVPIIACLNIPSSIGANAWPYGAAMRITSTGTPAGGLTNGSLRWAYNNGSTNFNCTQTNLVSIEDSPSPIHAHVILTNSQGTGSTIFSWRAWHPARMSWLTLDASGDDNWSPGGSASRVTRQLFPAFTVAEKRYWEESGIVTPLDVVNDKLAAVSISCIFGGDPNYHPFARGNVIGGGGTGNRPDLGFPNDYAAQAFVRGTQSDWSLARLFSLSSINYPNATILDEATGRIPVLNNGPPTGPGGNGVGGSYPQLGAATNLHYSTTFPADFAAALQNVPTAGDWWDAGIWPQRTYNGVDHYPNFQGFAYAIFGSRHFLDQIYMGGTAPYNDAYSHPGPGEGSRDDDLQGTSFHYYGLYLICCQSRGSARGLWNFVLPGALGGDNNIERTYYNDIVTENGNYYQRWLAWKDGPGNHNLENSILFPNWPGSGYIVDIFIGNYNFVLAYAMQTYLHAPMAASWLPVFERYFEGVCGEQAVGHPVSYYCIDYNTLPAVHNGDHSIQGPNVGQWINGTDASDFGSFNDNTNVLTGGQLEGVGGTYVFTNGDRVKVVNAAGQVGDFPFDQMPGDTWFEIMNVNNISSSHSTYYVRCPIGHAVDATCPTPGQPFTGFTRHGVPIAPEIDDYMIYRFQHDPGPGAGFADNTYGPLGKMIINGLQILGYDVSHAQSITDRRWGPFPWGYAPSQWWDPTIVVPQ